MKKLTCLLIAALLTVSLTACGYTPSEPTAQSSAPQESSAIAAAANTAQNTAANEKIGSAAADVDLTTLSKTVVYSEVYNMMTAPDNYIGKTVKMKGKFSIYTDSEGKGQYFACVIADAAACCSQGLEFVLAGEHKYPNDYPEIGSEITVTGTFQTYMEGESQYCHLVDAKFCE